MNRGIDSREDGNSPAPATASSSENGGKVWVFKGGNFAPPVGGGNGGGVGSGGWTILLLGNHDDLYWQPDNSPL